MLGFLFKLKKINIFLFRIQQEPEEAPVEEILRNCLECIRFLYNFHTAGAYCHAIMYTPAVGPEPLRTLLLLQKATGWR